jgi:hypothetical protein
MNYLRCDSCGHFNEVKTEYLSFCGACGKKLENCFQYWKKSNSGSFEDYKKENCIEQAAVSLPASPGKKRNPLRLPAYILLYFICLSSLILAKVYVFDKTVASMATLAGNASHGDLAVLNGAGWNSMDCDGILLQSPIKLNRNDELVELPPEIRELVSRLDIWSGSYSNSFYIMTSSTTYITGLPANLEGAATGSVNEMSRREGVSDFAYEESDIERSGKKGKLQKGRYRQNDIQMAFVNAIFAEESRLWQVAVGYYGGSPEGPEISNRVIDSIRLR